MAKHHGTFMAASGSSGGSGSGGEPPRKRKPTGQTSPADGAPIPIVMSSGFFIKLIGIILLPTIAAVGAGISMYYRADAHMQRIDIHPDASLLETKKDAQISRIKMLREVKRTVKLEIREVQVDQKKKLDEISDELKQQQKEGMQKILQEVRQTRRTVDRLGE